MSNLILQSIVNNISFNSLPTLWQEFNLKSFSKDKTLFDFQEEALKSALTGLWIYYERELDFRSNEKDEANQERKRKLHSIYSANGLSEKFDYNLKGREERKSAKLLQEYYKQEDSKISFAHFLNRMSFWMATGSGKTLVIVKLLEVLKTLIERKVIPAYDILFLTHREDLIDQFKKHIDEFNSYQREIKISLRSLKEYDSVKREAPSLFYQNEFRIFYYRSDLISDEPKEKLIDFKSFDNDGKWYILLDEAHKGDKEDSKRQILYSILSRNGFLFNFSATFVDPRDFATCVFNFNLSKFIQEGYGKHIYLSESEISAFKDKTDFSPIEKQKIVLKSLITLAYIRKFANEIKDFEKSMYHRPLLLTLVNSVNTEDADLELYFRELEKIGKGKIKKDLIEQAKEELLESFAENKKLQFEEDEKLKIDKDKLDKINFPDILSLVFNSKTCGETEVLKIPGNRKELIFKLKTAEKPFALIKIGDISNWLKEKLEGYEINESFENESVFKKINRDDSDINILMGSRTFYEGWDSNRPNLILYINIGVGKDAKKFVLQSTGRGVRIEPIRNERKRLAELYSARKISETIFEKIKDLVLPAETLFIFGTRAGNLAEIIATFEEESGEHLVTGIEINKEAEKHSLFIPIFKEAAYTFAESKEPQKFETSQEDLGLVGKYFAYLEDPRIFLIQYESEPRVFKTIKKSFADESTYYLTEEKTALSEPTIVLGQIVSHFSLVPKEFDKFKKLEEEIIHFRKIRYLGERKLEEFLKQVEKVRKYSEKAEKIEQLRIDFETKQEILESYRSQAFDGIKIKYVSNHYYIPLILSEKEKIDYLNHIIDTPSEVRFIEKLEAYLGREDNLFNEFDWWFFSKIDEHTDEVGLPYYNPASHKIENFRPDFIFWLCKGNEYQIVFIDPKGVGRSEYQHKADWYERLFKDDGQVKEFPLVKNFKIKVHLFLNVADINQVGEGYREFWFDNFDKMLKRVA